MKKNLKAKPVLKPSQKQPQPNQTPILPQKAFPKTLPQETTPPAAQKQTPKKDDHQVHDEANFVNYEDDFDEYEKDEFEEFDHDEFSNVSNTGSVRHEVVKGLDKAFDVPVDQQKNLDMVQKALLDENKKIISPNTPNSYEQKEPQKPLNTVLPQRKQFDLDPDLAPMNQYEVYIRNFGSSNTIQSSTQWNEDQTEKNIQTEDWDIQDKWTQAPSDGMKESDDSIPSHLAWLSNDYLKEDLFDEKGRRKSTSGGKKVKNTQKSFGINTRTGNIHIDSVKLIKFLRKSSQVMEILLEENTIDSGISGTFIQETNVPFAQGHITLKIPPFLTGRNFKHLSYSPIDHRILITTLSNPIIKLGKPASSWSSKGVLCIWRLTEPSHPIKILICDSEPTCVSFSTKKPHLIFAGTIDGGIYLWNLANDYSNKLSYTLSPPTTTSTPPHEYQIQMPSYSTNGLYTSFDQRVHQGAVRSIHTLDSFDYDQENLKNRNGHDGNNTNTAMVNKDEVQVCSVDEFGFVQFWTCVDVKKGGFLDGGGGVKREYSSMVRIMEVGEIDFGMTVGGSNRIIKGVGFESGKPKIANFKIDTEVLTSQIYQFDPTRILLGTEFGVVLNESRFQQTKLYPKSFIPKSFKSKKNLHTLDSICSIDFNKFNPNLFLTLSSTGKIRLHNIKFQEEVESWDLRTDQKKDETTPTNTAGTKIKWSTQRPSVFFLIDKGTNFYIFDLTQTTRSAVFKSSLEDLKRLSHKDGTKSTIEKGNFFDLAVSPGVAQIKSAKGLSGDDKGGNSLTYVHRHASCAVSFESNEMEVFVFDTEYGECGVDEEECLKHYEK